MIPAITLAALVICFTNFVPLHPCTQEGKKLEGLIWVAYDAIQTMRPVKECTELFFNGGGRAYVLETPQELIKLQEQRQDPN